MLKIFLFSLFLMFANVGRTENCPEGLRHPGRLPLCPEGSGSVLVPESNPVGAIVVSDGNLGGRSEFTIEVVDKVLVGAGADTPLILLPVGNDTFRKVKEHIDTMPVPETQKAQWKAALRQVPTESYTWQQDYMQPFVDPKSGQIQIREVAQYTSLRPRTIGSVDKIVRTGSGCGLTQGHPLQSKVKVNGIMGGNIDSLPGNICLLGSDHFADDGADYKAYADQVCPASQNDRIKVPTSWMLVGHTDEVIKVVRNNTAPAPCNFSVAVASPSKAIELLREKPKDPFLSFRAAQGLNQEDSTAKHIDDARGLRALCSFYKNMLVKSKPSAPDRSSHPKKGVGFMDLILPPAEAGITVVSKDQDCNHLTNGDVVKIYEKDENFKEFNEEVQKQMDLLKTELNSKLQSKFPQCKIDIFDLPNLFTGTVVHGPKGIELPKKGGSSVLPNPTNGISVNDTILTPEPINSAFRSYISEQYNNRGLRPDFVDTFDYAHVADGNLHCSTHTFHICQGRGRR